MAGECTSADVDNMYAPREINIVEFVECRALEMDEMMRSVSEPVIGGSRSIMQLVPRHMRRRAANHDVRRLPLKRRLEARNEMADSGKLRRWVSRRHRRRPKNLLKEYARRKRRNVWLESHIWHAKRFHMTERWGYKIPNYPNDRGERAAYRDATMRCVMMDLSYYCCIELTGQQQYLVDSLARITSQDTGPTFGAVCYLSGTRQGQTVVYRDNCYPFHALGEVTFFWRPLTTVPCNISGSVVATRQLWIWSHPACFADVLAELKKVFHLSEADCQSLPLMSGSSDVQNSETETVVGMRKRKKNKKKKGLDDTSSAKRVKLRDDGMVIMRTTSEESPESCVDGQHTPVCQSKPVELLTDTTTASSSVTSVPNMKFESRNPDSSNGSAKAKTMNVQQGDTMHLLSKTDLVQTVYENGKVRLESLKNDLCRFRLIGPKAHRIIVESLCLAETSFFDVSENGAANTIDVSTKVCRRWWDDYIVTEQGLAEAVHQAGSWRQMSQVQNASELPPSSVYGLTVRDPRLFLPQRRTLPSYSARDGEYPSTGVKNVDVLSSSSPLWDRAVRVEVQQTMMSTAELNRHRSKCLLPGSVPDLGSKESRVPVLLVQNSAFQNTCSQRQLHGGSGGGPGLDFGAGWDIILPAGWSMAFWIALVYRGAKAVGLQDQRRLAFEAGELTFPDSFPDTPAGAEMSSSRAAELRSKYDRRPPAKRCNYNKMGVSAPFHCPWSELVQGWARRCCEDGKVGDIDSDQLFYCVRKRRLLRLLEDMCAGVTKSSGRSSVCGRTTSDSVLTELRQSGRAIVKVSVAMLGRGAPSQFSLICLPTADDVMLQTRNRCCRDSVREPMEPLHRCKSSDTGLTPATTSVLGSADRPTIGFAVVGGFSHATARGHSVGFVSAIALAKLLEQQLNAASCKPCAVTVLVRCPHSLQYRLAALHVVV